MKLGDLFESKVAWKIIKDFSNYEVSTTGRVRARSTGKDVAPWESKRRGGETDLRVSLYHEGIKKGRRVHRLVAQAFLPNPQNLPEVDHKDGDSHNNNLSNLEWVTSAENAKRKHVRLGTGAR